MSAFVSAGLIHFIIVAAALGLASVFGDGGDP